MFDITLLAPYWDNINSFFDSPLGVFIYIVFYAIWVICLLPGSWPSMIAGAIYGSINGSLVVFLGAFIGANITFLVTRRFFRSWVQTRIASLPKLQLIEKAVSREGLKLVLLTRLSPAFPFSLLNLVYGLSEVKFNDFSIGMLGIVPGTFLFCSLGSLAGNISNFNEVLSQKENSNSFVYSLIALLATFTVVILISRAARKALQDLDSSI